MSKKVSRVDYSKSMLPRKRREQFIDVFKMNYMVILKCGLMLLLFFAPLLAFSVFGDFYFMSLIDNSTEDVEQTKMLFHWLFNLGMILFSLIAVLGFSGVIRVLRNLIWGEGIYFRDDFAEGIKQNAGKNIIFALIFGGLYALAYFIYSLFPETLISAFGLLMFALIFLPIFFWILFLNNTYSSSFGALLRNGLFFYVKTIGWSLLSMVVMLLLVGTIFIPMDLIWVKYAIIVMVIVFLYPIFLLIITLYVTSKFDAYINKDNYPDYYLRGLNHD